MRTNSTGSLAIFAATQGLRARYDFASNKIAEFGKYDSLVGLGISSAGVFSFDAQRMPSRKDGTRMGDEGKAVGIAQAPAALLSPHTLTIRSVITIAESRFFNKPSQ